MAIYTTASEVWADINNTNSVDQIINILADANSGNITLDANDLRNLVLSQSTTIEGSNTTLLYSGTVNGVEARGTAKLVASSNSGIAIIDNTDAGKLADNIEFKKAVDTSLQGDTTEFFRGTSTPESTLKENL